VEKKKGLRFFAQLFMATFTLSAFTFGGGYVIVPLMRKKFVEQYKWIDEREMLDFVAIAQSAPGPIAINASILVGYRLGGVPGAFVTVFGTVLPPLVTISVISFFYAAFRENRIVAPVLRGMSAGVAAVVADAIIKMGKDIVDEKRAFSLVVMVISFIAVFLFDVDVKIIILLCAATGIANEFLSRRRKRKADGGTPEGDDGRTDKDDGGETA
jgi:chromate transporter